MTRYYRLRAVRSAVSQESHGASGLWSFVGVFNWLFMMLTVGHGAMHATALCSEHQKSGASNTPPLAAATVDSIIRYLSRGLYIY
jgi:hypothetical protein